MNTVVALVILLAFCVNVAALVDVIRTPRAVFDRARRSKTTWLWATVLGCLFSVTIFGLVIGAWYFVGARGALSRAKAEAS
jgi:uncharacterized membrane protein